MNICITGSTGRLGKVLSSHFEETGDRVILFSRRPGHGRLATRNLPDFLQRENVDCVLHLAWSTLPATSEAEPGQESNVDLPLLDSLLGAMRNALNKQCLFVFFSTCAVYGEKLEEAKVFTEADQPAPKGSYARGKVEAENLIRRFSTECGLRSLILRVTNPYGFTQQQNCRQGVIPALAQAVLSGVDFEIWGEGCQTKDYLHVDDFCSAVDVAVRRGLTGIFNLASGRSIPLSEVVSLVERISGRCARITTSPARPWDVQKAEYSNQAISKATGWQPGIRFEGGLETFVGGLVSRDSGMIAEQGACDA